MTRGCRDSGRAFRLECEERAATFRHRGVHAIPKEIHCAVARMKLAAIGTRLDKLSASGRATDAPRDGGRRSASCGAAGDRVATGYGLPGLFTVTLEPPTLARSIFVENSSSSDTPAKTKGRP